MKSIRSVKRQYYKNKQALAGLRDQTGSGMHLFHRGIYAAVHSTPPPPVAEYDRWLAGYCETLATSARAKVGVDGATLRRWVIMRRQGSSQKECGSARGMSGEVVCRWLNRLPEELRP